MSKLEGTPRNTLAGDQGSASNADLIMDSKSAEVYKAWHACLPDEFKQGQNSNAIMRKVRDLVVCEGGFDRAGVFLYNSVTELFQGSWGTDIHGVEEDISTSVIPFEDLERRTWEAMQSGGKPYCIRHFEPEDSRGSFPAEMATVRDHVQVILSYYGELIGFVSIDNLISNRPITGADIEPLLAMTEYASASLLIATMREKRAEEIQRQERVTEISLAITSNRDIDTIYLMVRNAIMEIGFVDRAAVWVVSGNVACGTWGTDGSGLLKDEHAMSFPFDATSDFLAQFSGKDCKFVINTIRRKPEGSRVEIDVPHAFIPLKLDDEIIGIVTVDTLFSRRRITHAMLAPVMPITDQAAVAIHKARLVAEREAAVRQQKNLMEISVAIASNTDADAVLRMIRDAILDTGLVDRIGVWLVKGDTACGTWGTDIHGRPRDEHHTSFSLCDYRKEFSHCLVGHAPFQIKNSYTAFADGAELNASVPYAAIPLRAGGRLMGLITVDNILTKHALTPEKLEVLLPIVRQAAIALLKAELQMQREEVIRQQKQLMDIAAAITTNMDSDSVLRMVRDAIMEIGLVDRAGVWLVENQRSIGVWGTDEQGNLVDEHGISHPLDKVTDNHPEFFLGDDPYLISHSHSVTRASGEKVPNVSYALIALRADHELLGLISLDNLMTGREITTNTLDLLLPLAKQAAVAIQNARLLAAAEQEIERRREVEALLIAQARELMTARDDALAAARAKGEFLANMSHEIRTPMNGIIGMTAMLMETPLSAQQQLYLQNVSQCSESLLAVIKNILDFSRLEAGKLKIEQYEFNLRDCIEDVVGSMARQARECAIELNSFIPVGFPEILIGDGIRVRQMITNLVANAIKFTEKGEVLVEASCVEEGANTVKVRIKVQDTGIGIALDQRVSIYESFTQVDGSSTRKFGGSGLGLTITKQLVELMGGTIDLDTIVGKGSTFWLTIDFEKQHSSLEMTNREGDLSGATLLIVENNETRLRVLTCYSRAWGCEVVPCRSAPEAMNAARGRAESQHFNFLVVSAGFEDCGAAEIVAQLRRISATQNSKTLLLQSEFATEHERRSESAKFATVLPLPVRRQQFQRALASLKSESDSQVGVSSTQSGPSNLHLRVLMAEDNLVNAMVASSRLEMWGCTCIIAENGVEALKALQTGRFDVVLMDVSMPEMDGIEATRKIRHDEKSTGSHIPIIAMTAHALKGDRERCLAAGMDDYVAKPVDFDSLYSKLAAIAV